MNPGIRGLSTQFAQMPNGLLGNQTSVPMIDPYVYDQDALRYMRAVETADQASLEPPVRAALNSFVVDCKSRNIWNAIKSSCVLAGARTLAGALTPLAGVAPTNVNFVSGDYSRKSGLAGNQTNKYLNTNRPSNSDPLNSSHAAVYVSSFVPGPSAFIGFIGAGDQGVGSSNLFFNGTLNNVLIRSITQTQFIIAIGLPVATGILGLSRSTADAASVRINGSNLSRASSSTSASTLNWYVFSGNNNGAAVAPTGSRLSFYSIGAAIDLAHLDVTVSALMKDLAAAIP